jgi:hypothetical protein
VPLATGSESIGPMLCLSISPSVVALIGTWQSELGRCQGACQPPTARTTRDLMVVSIQPRLDGNCGAAVAYLGMTREVRSGDCVIGWMFGVMVVFGVCGGMGDEWMFVMALFGGWGRMEGVLTAAKSLRNNAAWSE